MSADEPVPPEDALTPLLAAWDEAQEAVACMGDFVGRAPAVWPDPPKGVYRVALGLHPNGREAALGLTDGTVRLHDLPGGAETACLRAHATGVFALAFGPDGKILVSADDGGTIKVWRPAGGAWQVAHSLTMSRSAWPNHVGAACVAVSADGRRLLACARGAPEVSVWDLATGAAEAPFRGPHGEPVFQLALSPDSQLLAWRGKDEVLHLWELASARARFWAADPDLEQRRSAGIAFCRGGKHLIFLNDSKSAEVRDLATGELAYAMGPIPPGQNNWYTGRRLSLDSSGTLLAAQFWEVPVWDLRRRRRLFSLPRGSAAPMCLGWDSAGKLLAVGSADGGLAVWDLPAMQAQLARIGLEW